MAEAIVPTDHAEFLSLLPGLATHARIRFRHLNAVDREEAVARAVAYGFATFLRLKQRGKQPTSFPAAFATFVVLAAAKGRSVGQSCTSRDVMGVDGRREFTVHGLDSPIPDGDGWWRDAVADRRASVADQACFNLDFAEWQASLPAAKKRIAGLLAYGHSTGATAQLAGVTPGRVSQVRRELAASWSAFQGDTGLHCLMSSAN